MIPPAVRLAVQDYLTKEAGTPQFLVDDRPVSGGCIHNSHWIKVNEKDYFIKFNRADALDNFEAERKGLDLLQATKTLRVPKTYAHFAANGNAVLLMEYIPSGAQDPDFWDWFGQGLAALHRKTRDTFGLDHANYIGSLHQHNDNRDSWLRFFIEMRLEKQLQLAETKLYAPKNLRSSFEDLYANLANILPEEPPALLHGDLWSGNFMTGAAGEPVIIDPAVYYGHREAEIAFTKMFGGFAPRFYEVYNDAFPLQPGWEDRVDLFNLYPLMVHFNLFGRSYLSEIEAVLKRYA